MRPKSVFTILLQDPEVFECEKLLKFSCDHQKTSANTSFDLSETETNFSERFGTYPTSYAPSQDLLVL